MKTVGLIGGMSWTSTELYYRELNREAQRTAGAGRSLPIVLWSLDFHAHLAIHEQLGWEGVQEEMIAIGRRLKLAGAELLAMCANTVHRVADAVQDGTGLPLISVVDVVGESVRSSGLECVGLLGTRHTTGESFYKDRLHDAYGVQVMVPERVDCERLDSIIYEKLAFDDYDERSRLAVMIIIDRLITRGATGIVLGCTELPRLLGQVQPACVVFDSLKLHVRAIVEAAVQSDG